MASAACGHEVPPGARFCPDCGARVEDAPAPSGEGERRQLTVLFCDLVGSTEHAARLDPEEWREVVRRYHEAASDVVARFGGHVAQHLGDGLLVYFGWPQAHEDAAERAVRAGLGIAEAIRAQPAAGATLSARVGLHTGPVVVGAIGARGRAETLALGNTPNVAARVQALAEPDTVLVTEATHRLVAGLFAVEERGAHALRGVPEAVSLYRVLAPTGVRGRFAAAAMRGLTPFVGRAEERRLLRSRWERARQGVGQVVVVTGEPGIGKSRLVQELKLELAATPHTWLECSGSPHHRTSPFHAVSELLRQGFAGSIATDGGPAALERALEAASLDVREAVPLLAPLLGVPFPAGRYPALPSRAEQQRARLLAVLVAWLSATARRQATVLLVEDLHWIDPSSLELCGLLVEQGNTLPLLQIHTARPEFRAPWPPRSQHARIELGRLTNAETHAMVSATAARAALRGGVLETVVERTDGVPLFVEELTKAVLEADAAAAAHEIPTTLADSLMARLDRLGPAKEVAQLAAAIGREFSYRMLSAVSGLPEERLHASLETLAGAELIYARGLPPEADYLFKHALVQDAAYQSLLKSRRRELHRSIAGALAERFPALAEAQPELVAQHWSEAGEARAAAEAWKRAADRALERGAPAEAEAQCRRALEALTALPVAAERSRLESALEIMLGTVLSLSRGHSSKELEQQLARTHELVDPLEDPGHAILQLGAQAALALGRGEIRSAVELADRLRIAAERDGSSRARMWARFVRGCARFHAGELCDARSELERARALHRPGDHGGLGFDLGVQARGYAAVAHGLMGEPDAARAVAREAVEIAQRFELASDVASGRLLAALLAVLLREPDAAAAHASEVVRVAREARLAPFTMAQGMIIEGWALAESGSVPNGIARIREGLASFEATSQRLALGLHRSLLAEALARSGEVEPALAIVDEAFAVVPEERVWTPDLHRLRGDLLARRGADESAAEASYREAVSLARSQGARTYELRAATRLARLLTAQDRSAEARDLLAPFAAALGEGGETLDRLEARELLASIR